MTYTTYENAEEIRDLIDEGITTVTTLAGRANLNPQTVYGAMNGKSLSKKSVIKLRKAVRALKDEGRVTG